MGDDTTFRLDEALEAQGAVRRSLGLPEEVFPIQAFVGMIADEIEASRRVGRDDQAIVDTIRAATGKAVTVEDIARHHVPSEARAHPGA